MLDVELLHLKDLPDEAVLNGATGSAAAKHLRRHAQAPRPIPRRTAAGVALAPPQGPPTWRSSSLAREASSRLNCEAPGCEGRALHRNCLGANYDQLIKVESSLPRPERQRGNEHHIKI